MADRLILCSECGTKNRVGGDRAGRPTCGNCGKALAVPGYSGAGKSQLSRSAFWFALGIASVVGVLYYNDSRFLETSGVFESLKSKQIKDQSLLTDEEAWGVQPPTKKQTSTLPSDVSSQFDPKSPMVPVPCSTARSTAESVFLEGPETCFYKLSVFRRLYPEFDLLTDNALIDCLESMKRNKADPLTYPGIFDEPISPKPKPISTGLLKRPKRESVAPLLVKTTPGFDYYVKLANPGDGLGAPPVMTLFIKGGESFETTVPLGNYEIRYAAGQTWYGETLRFGMCETSYSKAERTFQFDFDGQQYSGYTVELIMQTNGNLRVSPISAEQF